MTNKVLQHTTTSVQYAKPFFESFLVALAISWSPIAPLAYIMPLLCLGWFIVRANSGKTLLYLMAFLIFFTIVILFYQSFYYSVQDINFLTGGAILTLITYSSFIFLLITPFSVYSDRYSYLRYAVIIKYLILIQATLGILQLFATMALKSFSFDGSMGDKVQGTISPVSFLVGTSDFGNIAFATNMVFLLLFFVPYVMVYNKGKMVMAWGAFSLLCASVLHILIGLVGAIIIVGFFFRRFSKVSYKAFYVLITIGVGIGLLARLQPSNFTLIKNYAIIYAKAKSPKATQTITVVTDIPQEYPTMLFLGFGPGQYSSRASLIATGTYLGGINNNKDYFFLPNSMTKPFEEFMLDDWLESNIDAIYGGSAMSKPFYSVMSIYTEFGLIVLTTLFLLIGYQIIRLRSSFLQAAYTDEEKVSKFLSFSLALSMLFLTFICFIENYLEISQAIFPGLLMIKYFYSRSNTKSVG